MKTTSMKLLFLLLTICVFTFSQAQNTNVSNNIVFEGEPFLAIDPMNNQHLVAAWMGFKVNEAIVIKLSYSNDGGVTWSVPINLDHQIIGNTSADVSLQYDGSGNLFACYIDYNSTDFSNGAIFVRKSTDGGISWGNSSEAINITDCPNKLCLDRPWMVIDQSGNIFITSMNPDQPTLVTAPYNPYFVVSSDGGATFTFPQTIDAPNYLAGDLITQPVPTPAIGSDNAFYAAYPSYVPSQSLFAQIFLAKSTDLGANFTYSTILTGGDAVIDPFAKKASLLIADPNDADHLVHISLRDINGDADLFLIETLDGLNWSVPQRINQDGIGNGKMQDLLWADFNENSDLAVCWRDRRNASVNGYQTETEIYGAIKLNGEPDFLPDFVISSQQVSHDAILEAAGNDFMNVHFIADTIYTIWGDVRTGNLNIFINKMNVDTGTSSIQTIHQETGVIEIFPNPSKDFINLSNFDKVSEVKIINLSGQLIQNINKSVVNISDLPKGEYILIYNYQHKKLTTRFQKH